MNCSYYNVYEISIKKFIYEFHDILFSFNSKTIDDNNHYYYLSDNKYVSHINYSYE